MCTKLTKVDKNFTVFKIKKLVVYDNGYRNNRNESSFNLLQIIKSNNLHVASNKLKSFYYFFEFETLKNNHNKPEFMMK